MSKVSKKMPRKRKAPRTQPITRLGKIQSAEFGVCGPHNEMLGLKLLLAGADWNIPVVDAAPSHAALPEGQEPSWKEEDFNKATSTIVRSLGMLLRDCGKTELSEIAETPVEIITEGNQLKSWRVLKEVL